MAVPELEERVKNHLHGIVFIDTEKDIPWDGEGIPAMVAFVKDGKIMPL